MPRKDKTIEVRFDGTKYKTTTDPNSLPVKAGDNVHWFIDTKKPKTVNRLPEDAEVELRFASGLILSTTTLSDKKRRGIAGIVQTGTPVDTYTYKVWYVTTAEQYIMEDPELVMEGGRNVKRRRAAKKGKKAAQPRKAAKKR